MRCIVVKITTRAGDLTHVGGGAAAGGGDGATGATGAAVDVEAGMAMRNHFMGAGRFLGFDFDWSFRQCIGCHPARLIERPDTIWYWQQQRHLEKNRHSSGDSRSGGSGSGGSRSDAIEWCRFPRSTYRLLKSHTKLKAQLSALSERMLRRGSLLRFLFNQYPAFEDNGRSAALGRAFSPEYNASALTHRGALQMVLVERSILEGAQLLVEHIDRCSAIHGESTTLVGGDGCRRPACPIYYF